MTKEGSRIINRIHISKQTFLKDNKGSAIVMVLVAIAFVSIMGSMVMYSTFYNYKMKVIDRSAKDSFYSADLAMDEVRAGLQMVAADAFSEAYIDTLERYGDIEGVNLNEYLLNAYKNKVIDFLDSETDSQKYRISVLQEFLTQPADNRGEVGAYVESSTSAMLPFTDGIRLQDVCLTYTDPEGYVSIIETDFFLPYPNLGLGDTYEFPDIDEYCLIANEKLVAKKGTLSTTNRIVMSGGVYGGKQGVEVEPSVTMFVQSNEEEQANGKKYKFITDGDVVLGYGKDNTDPDNDTPVFAASSKISLWAGGVELNGKRATTGGNQGVELTWWERLIEWIIRWLFPWWPGFGGDENSEIQTYNLALAGDTYIQDDLTINSDASQVYIAGAYTGFGNTTTKAKNSSSIIVNGAEASLDMSDIKELNLGGNTYIGTSKLDVADIADATRKNEDIKMGNAVASKIEQLAYLVPAECIGYDVTNNQTVVGKNPVNVKDESYIQFMEDVKQNPDGYKEVNLNLIDVTVGKPLANYGATYEKVYFKADSETVWVYYYLKFTSTAEAAKFFEEYYKASPEEIDKYLGQYIQSFDIGTLGAENMNIVGNMITRTEGGETHLVSATVGSDQDEQIELNKKYAQYSNQFMSLCKKLTDNYANLSAKERNAGVYENLIKEEMIADYKKKGIFPSKYVVFKNETTDPDTYAILVLEGDGSAINVTTAINEAFVAFGIERNNTNREKVGLIVSERPLTTSSGFKFNGTIITKGSMTIYDNSASFSVANNMQDVLLGTYSYSYEGEDKELEALSLFRNAKGSEIGGSESGDEDTITADKLVVYENWTKK